MSVRISQYETGARIPGDDMIQKLVDALHCNYKAISDYSLGAAEDIIETLFWLEESASSLPARGKGFMARVQNITLALFSSCTRERDKIS